MKNVESPNVPDLKIMDYQGWGGFSSEETIPEGKDDTVLPNQPKPTVLGGSNG